MAELNAGWARPMLAKKFHYFPAGDVQSLCLSWWYGDNGERDDTDDEHKENCVRCKRLVKTHRTAGVTL